MSGARELLELRSATERLQAAIERCDWQAALTLESERRAALEAYVNAGDDEAARTLATLETDNNRLIGTVRHHRRRLERDVHTVRTGRAANDAYGRVADGGL